jgi:lipopolysaccharide O-acetyltransferase
MSKRDFSAESNLNLLFRIVRAGLARLRGFLFRILGLFSVGSGPNISFGKNPRFINTKSMQLGKSVHFGICARLESYGGFAVNGSPKLKVGNGSSFGDYCHIGASNSVTIGENVLGASGILIIDHNHGNPKVDLETSEVTDPKLRPLISKDTIVIGDNVWIGEGVIILGGSRIGCGAIIAANTTVRGEVKARSIYFGE